MPQRQPWSNKAVAPAKPTVEELEWLEQEGFIKDEEEEEGKVHMHNNASLSLREGF